MTRGMGRVRLSGVDEESEFDSGFDVREEVRRSWGSLTFERKIGSNVVSKWRGKRW